MNLKADKKAKQQGVTLIELMVAMAILSIVALPFLSSFVSAARNNGEALERTQGSALLMQMMERLEPQVWNTLTNQAKDARNIGQPPQASMTMKHSDLSYIPAGRQVVFTVGILNDDNLSDSSTGNDILQDDDLVKLTFDASTSSLSAVSGTSTKPFFDVFYRIFKANGEFYINSDNPVDMMMKLNAVSPLNISVTGRLWEDSELHINLNDGDVCSIYLLGSLNENGHQLNVINDGTGKVYYYEGFEETVGSGVLYSIQAEYQREVDGKMITQLASNVYR